VAHPDSPDEGARSPSGPQPATEIPAEAQWPPRGEVGRALAIVFGTTFALLIAQLAIPPVSGYTQLGLAIVLLQAPFWVWPRGASPSGYQCAFTIGPVWPGLRLALGTMAIVFPIFVGGFHLVYTQLLERPVEWTADRVARWDEALEYAPEVHCGRDVVVAWTQERTLWVIAPSNEAIALRPSAAILPDARGVSCRGGSTATVVGAVRPDGHGVFTVQPGQGLRLDLTGIDAFDYRITGQGGRLVPSDRIRLGTRGATPGDDGRLAGTHDLWWLVAFILIQLGLIALPEEHFFRGYLQSRLDVMWGKPWRLMGVQVGWGLIAASAAFALLHPILIPGPHRLLVFFPALLFGWLRARQGHLGAAIAVHAGSNLLLAIVGRMYA